MNGRTTSPSQTSMFKSIRARFSPVASHDSHAQHQISCTSLCCARSGSRVCVTEIGGCELEAAKLRDLGVREGAVVTVVKHGNPLLVRVDNARFGIGEIAAQNVLCEYLAESR